MQTFSALLDICAGNSPVTGEFPAQRPVMRSFDVFFDMRLNKQLSKQSWGWWFEMLTCPLWRPSNVCKIFQALQLIVIWSLSPQKRTYINRLVQDCSNYIANALELLQSCTKASISLYDWNDADEALSGFVFLSSPVCWHSSFLY